MNIFDHIFIQLFEPPEFVLNLLIEDEGRTINQMTTKYLGMKDMPVHEAPVDFNQDCSPDGYLVDFIFNVLKMGLRTPEQIIKFVNTKSMPNVRSFLLQEAETQTLLLGGEHEPFQKMILDEAEEVMIQVNEMMNVLSKDTFSPIK